MDNSQPGILAPVPPFSRYFEFRLLPDSNPNDTLASLSNLDWGDGAVVGFGAGLLKAVGREVDGIRPFPAMSGPGCDVPSTQADLWCWARGEDRGTIVHDGRGFTQLVEPAFECEHIVDGFRYDSGLDLTGYEDGTENPEGDAAIEAAIVKGQGAGLDGASFVSTQQWLHNLDYFDSMPQDTRDNIIGRRLSDNEELDDAPESAHVKRTAQESFDPEAFLVRRSMPWADSSGEGLMFVAFGKSLDAFEVQLGRMTGQEDDIVDGLFRFSRPITGSHFWCPPVAGGKLDLGFLGI